MHTRRRFLLQNGLILGMAAVLCGCGQKGPLYFPEAETQAGKAADDGKKPAKKPAKG